MNSENNERKWQVGRARAMGLLLCCCILEPGGTRTHISLFAQHFSCRPRCWWVRKAEAGVHPVSGAARVKRKNRDETLVAADHAPDCEVVRTIPTCISDAEIDEQSEARGLRYTEIAEGRQSGCITNEYTLRVSTSAFRGGATAGLHAHGRMGHILRRALFIEEKCFLIVGKKKLPSWLHWLSAFRPTDWVWLVMVDVHRKAEESCART